MQRYGIMGIPTLILFKNGEAVVRITGYQPKQQIVSKLTPHL
ncbi:MAG: thioredoxin family protein [Phototrophicaceae bacterium]